MRWRAWLVALFATIGLLIAAGLWLAGERRTLVVGLSLWAVPLVLVAVIVGLMLAIYWHTRRVRKVREVAAAQAADRARLAHRTFVSRMDHELKNPITALQMAISSVSDKSLARTMTNQVGRLSSLITELRKISEIDTYELSLEPVDLPELLLEVQESIGDCDREFVYGFPKAPRPLPPVFADRDLLFLALYNIISNAVKYSQPGATVECRGHEEGANVVLVVADTGRGIPPEELEAVWDELVRGGQVHDVPGSGLGLPMVAAIMRRLGGKYELSSLLERGTTVRLALPLATRAA